MYCGPPLNVSVKSSFTNDLVIRRHITSDSEVSLENQEQYDNIYDKYIKFPGTSHFAALQSNILPKLCVLVIFVTVLHSWFYIGFT